MTIKACKSLADHIRQHNNFEPDKFTEAQIKQLARFCKAQAANFDKDRWLKYVTEPFPGDPAK